MLIQTEQAFKKEIASGELKSLFFICGEEKYLVRRCTQALIRKAVGKQVSDFDFIRLNSAASLETLFEAAEMLPVTAKRKCVCVTDYDIAALSESDYQELERFCSDVSPYTVLIFTMPTLQESEKKKTSGEKKPSRMKKFQSTVEKYGVVVRLDPLKEADLVQQLMQWAEKDGSHLAQRTAADMVMRVGSDLNALRSEIEKLCAYCQGREITRQDLDLLCTQNDEVNTFALSNAIASNNYNASFEELHRLFGQKIPGELILSQLGSTFMDMYRAKAASEAGVSLQQAAEDFQYGRREFVLRRAKTNAVRFSTAALREILEEIVQADMRMKSTMTASDILLETLLAKILLIIRKDREYDKS